MKRKYVIKQIRGGIFIFSFKDTNYKKYADEYNDVFFIPKHAKIEYATDQCHPLFVKFGRIYVRTLFIDYSSRQRCKGIKHKLVPIYFKDLKDGYSFDNLDSAILKAELIKQDWEEEKEEEIAVAYASR